MNFPLPLSTRSSHTTEHAIHSPTSKKRPRILARVSASDFGGFVAASARSSAAVGPSGTMPASGGKPPISEGIAMAVARENA